MGVGRGLELAADALRPGDKALAARLESLRIAIAAHGVDLAIPSHWPERGQG